MALRLSAHQIEELRAELSRILKKLERSMRATENAMRPVELDQTAVGRISRMDSLQNQGLTRNLQEREAMKLAQVQSALARLEAGTYGTCTECGAAVPFERLMIFPETPTCAACAEG
ncbi:MAG TPA: TraR/DksA family transcriptional regulator [Longimicrobiales bacterium]|nr:TraR/DksA family transcriptional regulator [Longimicrobiales bacterium]